MITLEETIISTTVVPSSTAIHAGVSQ
ncbi:Protein of unknown function [Weissella confusa LBAE C39-2]|nr:Protein of unknown function [Weissella confusa LBAE C39-2]